MPEPGGFGGGGFGGGGGYGGGGGRRAGRGRKGAGYGTPSGGPKGGGQPDGFSSISSAIDKAKKAAAGLAPTPTGGVADFLSEHWGIGTANITDPYSGETISGLSVDPGKIAGGILGSLSGIPGGSIIGGYLGGKLGPGESFVDSRSYGPADAQTADSGSQVSTDGYLGGSGGGNRNLNQTYSSMPRTSNIETSTPTYTGATNYNFMNAQNEYAQGSFQPWWRQGYAYAG